MKKLFLTICLALPFLASAGDESTIESSMLLPTAIFVLGVGIILFTLMAYFFMTAGRKNELLNSNIARVKAELAQKGHDPEQALINILHKESSMYKEPEELEHAIEEIAHIEETHEEEPDHSLALKVADEIVRIQKNLSQMDVSVKGLKQVNASVDRIANNFAANGYELVQMLNKPFNEGMKLEANFVPSEELKEGEQIITRIIKPQVNFHGEMIQAAQVEVSIGE